jgi:RHS repeat-associated protein
MQSGKITTRYRHNAAGQMTRAGTETLAYDANGNLISRRGAGDWRYTYDTGNQLIKATGPEGIEVRYGYDPTGNRVWREDMKGRNWFLHDGLDLVQILDADLKAEVTYIHAPGIDRPVAMLRDGKAYYYHIDHLASIRRLTDEHAKVVAAYDYDAFGNRKILKESIENPFAYTGRELDAVTGLYYFRARYYDPKLGRFISTDPVPSGLENAIGHNPYLYALNNPLRFTDPLGLNAAERWPFLRNAYSPERISRWGNDILRFEYLKAKAIISGKLPVEKQVSPQHLNKVAQNLKNMEQVMRQRGILSTVKPTTTQPIPRSALPPAEGAARYTQTQGLQGQRTGSHTARLGTRGIAAPPPAGGQAKTPWWKRSTLPKSSSRRGGLAGGIGGATVFGGTNFIACRYEGMTWGECASEATWSLAKGAVIGAGVGVVVATGGTAAVLVGGLVTAAGGYSTAKRVYTASAVGEQRQAEQRLAEVQQEMLNRMRLGKIDARIQQLQQLAAQIDADKEKAKQDISKAEQAYEAFKGDIERVKKKVAELNCANIGTQLREAGECQAAAIALAAKAKQNLDNAESLLRTCTIPSQSGAVASPVPAADQLVTEAKGHAKEAETKHLADDCQLEKLAAEVSAVKKKAATIRSEFRKIDELRNVLYKVAWSGDKSKLVALTDNRYARNAYLVDQAKEVNRQLDKIKDDSTRFENEKNELLNKIIPNLLNSWRGDASELNKREQQLQKIIPAIETDPEKYAQRLEKFSRIDLMSHILGTMTESATLSACEELDMGGVKREHRLAREAVQDLQPLSDRLAKIAAAKQACLARLAQKKPPAKQKLERLVINPPLVECEVGQQCAPFTLIGEYSDKSQKVITTNPGDWWPPQPIRAISPGKFTVTATYSGMTATATVKIIPAAQATKGATQQAPTGTGATPGRMELVGWGIVEPKTRKMRKGDAVPSFKFGFAYLDYGDPNVPSLYEEVIANCNPPKSGLGRRIVDCTAVDPKSSSGKQYSDEAVVIVEAADDCIGDNWRLGCDPMLLGSPMIKPSPGQRAQVEKLIEEMQTQKPQGLGQPGQLIPPEYTAPGEQAGATKKATTQLWPPRKPSVGGVEEFLQGPLIQAHPPDPVKGPQKKSKSSRKGKGSPEQGGCNGDCTQSPVKTTADPSINEQETTAAGTASEPVKQSGRTKCQSLAYHILVEWQPMQSPYASWVTREMKICDSNKEAFQNIYPWVQEFKAAGCTFQEAIGHVYPKGDYYAGKEAEHLKEAFDDAAFWNSRCQPKGGAPIDPGAGPVTGGSSIPQ